MATDFELAQEEQRKLFGPRSPDPILPPASNVVVGKPGDFMVRGADKVLAPGTDPRQMPASPAVAAPVNPSYAVMAGYKPDPKTATALAKDGHITPKQAVSFGANPGDFGLGAAQNNIGGAIKEADKNTEAYVAGVAESTKKREDLINQQAELAAQKGAEEAAAQVAHNQVMQAHNEQQVKTENDWQNHIESKRQEITKLVDDARSSKVDPELARGNLGERAIAGLSIALGAMGSAYGGGPNIALGIVQKHIDDNLAAQKENIGQKWRGVDAAKGEYQDLRNQLGDAKQADEVFRSREYTKMADYLKGLNLEYAPEQTKQNAQMMIADFEQKAMDGVNGALNQAASNKVNWTNAQANIAAQRGSLANQNAQLDMQRSQMVKKGGSTEEVQKQVVARDEMLALTDQLKSIGKKGHAMPWSERKHNAEALMGQLRAKVKEYYNTGKNDKLLNGIIDGDVTDLMNGSVSAKLAQLENTLNNDTVAKLMAKSGGIPRRKDIGDEGAAD